MRTHSLNPVLLSLPLLLRRNLLLPTQNLPPNPAFLLIHPPILHSPVSKDLAPLPPEKLPIRSLDRVHLVSGEMKGGGDRCWGANEGFGRCREGGEGEEGSEKVREGWNERTGEGGEKGLKTEGDDREGGGGGSVSFGWTRETWDGSGKTLKRA